MSVDNENKTVAQHCQYLGWPVAELARQAGISWERAKLAFDRQPVTDRIKRAIAAAISKANGTNIQVGDIQW